VAALDGLLPSASDADAALGTTGLIPQGTRSKLRSDSDLTFSNDACKVIDFIVGDGAYRNSGFTDLRTKGYADTNAGQVHKFVGVGVVLFPTAQNATDFYNASSQSWAACSNLQYSVTANGVTVNDTVSQLSDTNGILSVQQTQGLSDKLYCQRALTSGNNVVIDAQACSDATPNVTAAATITQQIAAKLAHP
jgi:PknH-like extracellular domain